MGVCSKTWSTLRRVSVGWEISLEPEVWRDACSCSQCKTCISAGVCSSATFFFGAALESGPCAAAPGCIYGPLPLVLSSWIEPVQSVPPSVFTPVKVWKGRQQLSNTPGSSSLIPTNNLLVWFVIILLNKKLFSLLSAEADDCVFIWWYVNVPLFL